MKVVSKLAAWFPFDEEATKRGKNEAFVVVAVVATLVALVAVVADVALVAVAAFPPMFRPAAVPVIFVPTKAEGVPRAGVSKVGLSLKTTKPLPVSFVRAVANCAEVKAPNDVALPIEVTAPVKLALVVTFPAVSPAAVPVMLVPTSADGVPNAGVTKVGEVARTIAPEPVVVFPKIVALALNA